MIVALIDNGSLEPAAQLNLRSVAAALSRSAAVKVVSVSWKHSDRVPPSALSGEPAWTLRPWVTAELHRGEREFVFVPFFISPQGAIGSALRGDLERLQLEAAASGGFRFTFSEGLAESGIIGEIIAERVEQVISASSLDRPAVVVVDHGGPSQASAALRDSLANQVREILSGRMSCLVAASMEGLHGPLLADQLGTPGFNGSDVVVAPLFLSPGRHAGPDGDIGQICRAAEARRPALRCLITGLVGTHPGVIEPLALALRKTLATFHLPSLA
ncbi:MAG: CbiX/SirB N-terminal domain-containing protein [Opitutaceae bacterium]